MRIPELAPGEWVRADMTTPARALTRPFIEFLVITGILWMAIGFIDDPSGVAFDPAVRNVLVGLWLVIGVWRLVLPMIRARFKRVIVTNYRVILRAPSWRGKVDSIPLQEIYGARKHRRGLSIDTARLRRPIYVPDVPKAKKLVALINER